MIKLTINGLDEIAIFIISPFSGSKLSSIIDDKNKWDKYIELLSNHKKIRIILFSFLIAVESVISLLFA